MKRTIAIKAKTSSSDKKDLVELTAAYIEACNQISSHAYEDRCWNRVALHNRVYSNIRASSPLGSPKCPIDEDLLTMRI